MNIPCPMVRPFRGTPLKAAPLGKAASAAPVTPVSCAAAGAGAVRLASPSIAANSNPSRVIVSPSAATLLVDLDVPADNWALATLVDVRDVVPVGVCDLECVLVLARRPLVLDIGREAARIAVRGARP